MDERTSRESVKRRYASPRPRWQTWLAIAVALSVGGGLLWTMRSAFRVGENMMKSVEESRPPPQHRSRSGPSLRARSEAEEAESRAKLEAEQPQRKVRGVLKLPPNVPSDEEVFALLFAGCDDLQPCARARIAADGTFELAAPADVTLARVGLEAHYLFLDVCRHVNVRESNLVVELDPKLGGRIVVACDTTGVVPEHLRMLRELRTYIGYWNGEPEVQHRLLGTAADWDRCRYERSTRERPITAPASGALSFDYGGVMPDVDCVLVGDEATPRLFVGLASNFRVGAGETRRLTCSVRPGVLVAGVARGADDGPLSGVRCELASTDSDAEVQNRWPDFVVSGLDGRFELFAFGAGIVQLRASRDGYHTVDVELGAIDLDVPRHDVDVRMLAIRGTHSVRGRVVWEDGTPAGGAWVAARMCDATDEAPQVRRSDEDGAFEFDGFDAWRVELVALAREYERAGDGEVEIGADELVRSGVAAARVDVRESRTVDLRLVAGNVLRGRVVDEEGAPHARFLIEADPELSSGIPVLHVSRSFSAEDGSFVIDGLIPAKWRVGATDGLHRSPGADVDLASGSTFLQLTVPRRPTLTGRIADYAAGASPIRFVSATPLDPSLDAAARQAVDAPLAVDGSFEFADLRPGHYDVRAVSPTLRSTNSVRVEIVANARAEPITLTLCGATLRVRIVDAHGQIVYDASLGLRRYRAGTSERGFAMEKDGEGLFVLDGLIDGQYELTAYNNGTSCGSEKCWLSLGETRDVTLRVR